MAWVAVATNASAAKAMKVFRIVTAISPSPVEVKAHCTRFVNRVQGVAQYRYLGLL